MTDRPFEYDAELLELCAKSNLVAQIRKTSDTSNFDFGTGNSNHDEACRALFQQYQAHYDREWSSDTGEFKIDDSGSKYLFIGRRLSNFLSSVALVHEHKQAQVQHRRLNQRREHAIGLNQFADMDSPPLITTEDDWIHLWDEDWDTKTIMELDGMVVQRLHDHDSIKTAAKSIMRVELDEDYVDMSRHHSKRHHHQQQHAAANTLHGPSFKKIPKMKVSQDYDFAFQSDINPNNPAATSTVPGNINTTTTPGAMLPDERAFDTFLNWATTDNPDGVPIVHTASDQGACGSCWAFSATGTLEASAVRRIAFQAYTKNVQDTMYQDDDVARDESVSIAQGAESDSIKKADLSVQELVDCDTYADQGCTGGNPLLAFYFIHRFGLTSSDKYPYVGEQELCKIERVAHPIATVESWGILTPNHEDNMELVLRYIGPVAVGVNGADPKFLAYTGGIFHSDDCEQGANHALLIVGYGQERDDVTGEMIRYWIARNSWGKGWGENGYVRVKRGDGSKGTAGVCGIARSPSVALGGTLLPASGVTPSNPDSNISSEPQRLESSLVYSCCEMMGLGDVPRCNHIEGFLKRHQTVVFLCACLLFCIMLLVFPTTPGCGRRRRRRHEQVENPREDDADGNEGSSLLGQDESLTTNYGSNV